MALLSACRFRAPARIPEPARASVSSLRRVARTRGSEGTERRAGATGIAAPSGRLGLQVQTAGLRVSSGAGWGSQGPAGRGLSVWEAPGLPPRR